VTAISAGGDAFWATFDALIENDPQKRFQNFVEQNPAKSWFIASDYVISDNTRPNDCICFTVYPIDERDPLAIWREIPPVLSRDFKKVRSLSREIVSFLRHNSQFSLCLILTKERHSGDHQ
jgi:hypothetical protein